MIIEPLTVGDYKDHYNLNMLASRSVNGVRLRMYIRTYASSGKSDYIIENATIRKQWTMQSLDGAIGLFNTKMNESANVRV